LGEKMMARTPKAPPTGGLKAFIPVATIPHEFRGEGGELDQDICHTALRWPNPQFIAVPLDHQVHVPAAVGQLGWDADSLRIAAFE
jgi:hypothetical protein